MPNCSKCASGKTIKNGIHLGRQRYRCKDCCFQFTRETPWERPAREKATAVLLYTLSLSFNAIARIITLPRQQSCAGQEALPKKPMKTRTGSSCYY
jgi:Transposase and inactivated derivatives